MNANRKYVYLLPAVAMMLGWGLRGFIGGGPFGAMIPGAMVALALCLLYPRRDAAMLAAFAAVGVGFGGEMTYGQTVGYSVKADTFWWGILGLALKGAIWGALGGAVIALGMTAKTRLVAIGGVVMLAATWAGWKLINEPKWIYFSNPIDKPRPEIWAGFLLAAAALVGWLAWQGKAQLAVRFAVAGFIGGWIGFGGGGAIQGLGRIFTPELHLHWWKYMEFFFGFCFGWALAWAMAHSPFVEEAEETGGTQPGAAVELGVAALLAAGLFVVAWQLPARFAYMLGGVAVLVLLTRVRWAARHVAYSITFTAFAMDLARYWSREYKRGAPEPAYALAIAASLVFAWYVRKWDGDTRRVLELLVWTSLVDATIKFGIHPDGLMNMVDHVCIGFALMGAAVIWMGRRVVPA